MSSVWWGYNKDDQWVALDRSLRPNAPGGSGSLLMFRRKDSTLFELPREDWTPPNYVFSERYIESLAPENRKTARTSLEEFQAEWPTYAESIRSQAVRLIRASFFQRIGGSDPGTRNSQGHRGRRITHCWSCKGPLDNAFDAECLACNWIVCSCGACGCG